jgi:CheY-like chemotaxis protein
MSAFRVLHVDDEPDIREVVAMALDLDRAFAVKGCSSGGEALLAAAEWSPNLILLDVMMPGMDGPMTLARLRRSPKTATIPIVFMTARAQSREIEHFVSLGAEGVIPKPFDPMTLAACVRGYVRIPEPTLAARRGSFVVRARADAVTLGQCRADIADKGKAAAALRRIVEITDGLADAAAAFDLEGISAEATALRQAAGRQQDGSGGPDDVERAIDRLLARIAIT